MFTTTEILAQLDECSEAYCFPKLDNGYVHPAGTRLSAYRDKLRWTLIIETIGFNYRGGGHNGIINSLYVFGNCLNYSPGLQNENILYVTGDSDSGETFNEEGFLLNPTTPYFLLRSEKKPLIHSREQYTKHGIELDKPDSINAYEFLRLLDALYHNKLIATEAEIRERIPVDLPRVLELQEWLHPNIVMGEKPGENETFQLLARVLETGDVSLYKPTQKPNTH